jgi:hypothetical protein
MTGMIVLIGLTLSPWIRETRRSILPENDCGESQDEVLHVAELCGLNFKIYLMKYKIGLAQHYRQGDEGACIIMLQGNPDFFHSNNGDVSLIAIDPTTGFPNKESMDTGTGTVP